MLEGYDAELGSSDGFEGTIDGADRGAGGGNDDNFVGTVIRLIREVGDCDVGNSVASVPWSG